MDEKEKMRKVAIMISMKLNNYRGDKLITTLVTKRQRKIRITRKKKKKERKKKKSKKERKKASKKERKGKKERTNARKYFKS